MADEIARESSPRAAPSRQNFLVTFALIFVAIAGLFAADTFLAGVQQRAGRAEAAARYREGEAYMARGDAAHAIDRLKAATAIDRLNSRYALALGDALLRAGKGKAAAAVLNPVLERDPDDGAAGLAMARVLRSLGRPEEAISFYHRAIFGHWAGGQAAERTAVRLELVDFLAERGARQELLAELLPLESESPEDSALQRRRAHLFVAAGSPARAVPIFRDMLRRDGSDADALAGMGDAEAAQGNYRSAEVHLAAAARLRPGDAAIEAELAQVSRIRGLDPTQRGIADADRRRRSATLLGYALVAADRCPAAAADSTARPALDSARAELGRPVGATAPAAAAERLMDRAEQIWRLTEGCAEGGTADQRAAAVVLNKLSE
jgi:tetratricopeptide (TPR) repeat protein